MLRVNTLMEGGKGVKTDVFYEKNKILYSSLSTRKVCKMFEDDILKISGYAGLGIVYCFESFINPRP